MHQFTDGLVEAVGELTRELTPGVIAVWPDQGVGGVAGPRSRFDSPSSSTQRVDVHETDGVGDAGTGNAAHGSGV